MDCQEKKELYKKALLKWGPDLQLGMLQEECAELIVAINKLRRTGDPSSLGKLAEEIADVLIMTEQIEIHLANLGYVRTVSNMKELKLSRLKKTLERVES